MEQKVKIKAYKVNKICPKCQIGTMEYTGVMTRSFIPTYQHKCVNCGFVDFLENKYPKYEYEGTSVFKLTKKERTFCELIRDGYIARDSNGEIWWYSYKPHKAAEGDWDGSGEFILPLEMFHGISFTFITWEDEQPWAVEDLLKLEVEDD